jgi:hypothetical protein
MDHKTFKCPFRHTLITRDYACEKAQEVTYRDGPGITCTDEAAFQRCTELFEALKAAALPAFEVSDDLTEMPASVISKIQYGGLSALSLQTQENDAAISNINALVVTAMEKYGDVEHLDFDSIVPVIRDYRMRRRRKS